MNPRFILSGTSLLLFTLIQVKSSAINISKSQNQTVTQTYAIVNQSQNQLNNTINIQVTSASSQVNITTNVQPANTDIKKCKNVVYYPVSTVNFKELMGKWYSVNPVTKKLCETCQYTEKTEGTFMKVCKVLVSLSMAKKMKAEEKAQVQNFSNGNVKVKTIVAARYSVIGTDYKSYAVLYYCNEGNPSVKLKTRQSRPTQLVWDNIFDVLENNTISSEAINTPSNNCF